MTDHADTIRRDYTQVCRCEWSSDDETVLDTNPDCVIHGSKPDPLDALLADLRQAQEERDGAIRALKMAATVHEKTCDDRQQAIDALREIADNPYGDTSLEFVRSQARAALADLGEQP